MTTPSHQITNDGNKVVIHNLEVFCAYDPSIDNDSDEELAKFDNDRVMDIVESTQQYMSKGSFPRLVVMHERDGNEPKSSVGRFTKIGYEERGGVGYIVGDCEVERSVFDKLLATNAFPRRSAEIWQEHNHLSEVALLGRETPRRPLPDTHFAARGERVTFSRKLRFDMGTVGGGLSTFIPTTKEAKMDNKEICAEIETLKSSMNEISEKFKKLFAETDNEDEDKVDMSADDMIQQQFGEDDEGDVHIDIGDPHNDEEEQLSRYSRNHGGHDMISMRRENHRMLRELQEIRAELSREKFSRELDSMESEGYRIPAERRPRLIAELSSSRNPAELIDTWRDMFARDPMGMRIDMSRASLPKSEIDSKQISELVKEFAGNPAEFTKAVNSRLKTR